MLLLLASIRDISTSIGRSAHSKMMRMFIFHGAGDIALGPAIKTDIAIRANGVPATSETLPLNFGRDSAAHGARIETIRHQTAARILSRALRILRGLLVVNSLVASHEANSFGMLLFNILRHKADLGALLAFILITIDWLPIIGLANLLDIGLQALIREKASGLGRRCGRARQRAGSLRNVRKKLRYLEGIALLLLKLLIEGSIKRLLRLLRDLACLQLRLRALEPGALGSLAKGSKLLASLHLAGKIGCHNALLASSQLSGLPIPLLVEGRNSLPKSKILLAL